MSAPARSPAVRDRQITMRLSTAEYESLRVLAEREDRSISSLVRLTLRQHLTYPTRADRSSQGVSE